MNNNDLQKYKIKLGELSVNDKKLRDLYLRDLVLGKIQGPLVGYASIDKPWLKYYSEDAIMQDIPKKTLYRYAKENCEHFLSDVAIDYFGFNITTKELFKNIDKAANSFAALGVKEGDVVTICSPTFPETIYANFALMKIGAIANNIDPRNHANGIKEDINKVKSDYLIVLDIAYPKIANVIGNTNVKKVICVSYTDSIPLLCKSAFKKKLSKKLAKKDINFPNIAYGDFYLNWSQFLKIGKKYNAKECEYVPNRAVAMVRTGGTTGAPKSVVLTNDSALALIEQYKVTDLGLQRGQSLLNIMPEFIAYGWTFGVVMATSLGIKNIIIPQFEQNEFADYIIKYKPNHLVGVPTHYVYLSKDEKMKNIDFSQFLTSISAGGDKFFEKSEKEFNDFLHQHHYNKNVIVGYGLTERNSSVSTRLNKCNVVGSSGVPLVKNTISIFKFPTDSNSDEINEDEMQYTSGDNDKEYGEVCISGPSSMLGYYGNIEETNAVQKVHSDGTLWTHTKDRGWMDENGILYIDGRTKNMIIRPDGHNVWPLRMENVILSHDKVQDCCVVGIPCDDSISGEFPRAVVVLKKEYANEKKEIEMELRSLCSAMLPERDVPITYSFRDSLPLTDIGKINSSEVKRIELKSINKKEKRLEKIKRES